MLISGRKIIFTRVRAPLPGLPGLHARMNVRRTSAA